MATRTITGTIHRADDTPWSGLTLRFRMAGSAFTATTGYPADGVTVTTGSDGTFSVTLVSGLSVEWDVSAPGLRPFRFPLADGATIDLAALAAESATPPESTVADLLAAHTADTDNPHSVTAAQVGAYTTAEVDDLIDNVGGGGTWGSITGTLANQTDLQTALNGKSDDDHTHAELHTHANSATLDAITAAYTTDDEAKLDGIEALADVTDAANVEAAGAVMDSGDQTVAGVKTFSSSPIVPAPTTDLQAATKKYVDDNAGGGGGAVPWTGWVINNWMDSTSVFGANTGTASTQVEYLKLCPIYIGEDVTVDRIGFNVTTLATGGSARLGIFTADADADTVTLVLDAGTVSTATTGLKEITISEALAAGVYWLGILADVSATITGLTPFATPGHVGIANLAAGSDQYRRSAQKTGVTFGAFAASYTSLNWGVTTSIPRLGLRRSA